MMIDSLMVLAIDVPAGQSDGEGSMTWLLIYIGIALGVSFLCSVLEAVLLSTTHSHVELAVQNGSRGGRVMRGLKKNIDNAISAILTLNTIAHTIGATGAGAEAAAYYGSQWIGVIGIVLTLLILIVSEIIPKTLGAVYWKQLMPMSAYTIQFLVRVLYPIVWACHVMTDVLKPKHKAPTVTRTELEILARLGEKEGTLDDREIRVFQNLLRLKDVSVKDIMTPRIVMFALEESLTVGEVMEQHPELDFSRIPIFKDDHDSIGRFVLRHEILGHAANDKLDVSLFDMSRPLRVVPETITVAELLESCVSDGERRRAERRARRQGESPEPRPNQHVFLVVDEYGGTEGLVTLEDALESLLGLEITDESDPATDMREVARDKADEMAEERRKRAEKAQKRGEGTP